MNPQPYETPPRWWSSELHPLFVKFWGLVRHYELRQQRIDRITVEQAEPVRQLLDEGVRVLIAANHSFHYDSYVLIDAARQLGRPCHFMTAWQVFALTGAIGRRILRWHGCFSVNREAIDRKAFRHAGEVLAEGRGPLVVFPEGDLYHSNDRVMPFREGAAAIALSVARRGKQKVAVVPTALKCYYTENPVPELARLMDRLEEQIRWRPASDLPLIERIYRFGVGCIALKEIEYLGVTQAGTLPERLRSLEDAILNRVQDRHRLPRRGRSVPERIRELRTHVIAQLDEKRNGDVSADERQALRKDLDDLFFATQLFSYHGNYTAEHPSVERAAETLDKFEEDFFGLQAPTPRGRRRAVVRFGDPIEVSTDRSLSTSELTVQTEQAVQRMLDELGQSSSLMLTNPPCSHEAEPSPDEVMSESTTHR